MSKIRKSAITYADHYRFSAIYLIKNRVNGKVYVGQTVNLYERYQRHKRSARSKDASRAIVAAFKKYGFDSFDFFILEEILDKLNLTVREQYWMDKYNSSKKSHGYNLCPAAGSPYGLKHSDETKKKVSAAMSGRKPSEETRNKMSLWHTGKTVSEETRKKISQAQKGIKRGDINGKSVAQYCRLTGEVIAKFISISKASRETGIGLSNIAYVCKNKRKTAGGYVWRYLNVSDT